MMDGTDLKALSQRLRLSVLKMAFTCGKNGSHLGASLSSIELFATLYSRILHYNVNNPDDKNRDRLVVSKGHCVLAYYSVLREVGFLSDEDIERFETNGSYFHGHAMRNIQNGIEFSGGSLGMGMSFAVGQAMACKKKGLSNRVFAMVGDGECDEGLIWESAMSAAHFKLNNFTLIVDKNKLQYDGPTTEVMDQTDLGDKFKAFGFDVREVDGHNCKELAAALGNQSDKALCVIANTIKGKGVSFMEGRKEWHHSTLSAEQYEQARKEVENG